MVVAGAVIGVIFGVRQDAVGWAVGAFFIYTLDASNHRITKYQDIEKGTRRKEHPANMINHRLVRPLDLGRLDDAHHDYDDQVYLQAGKRTRSASEPLSPRIRVPNQWNSTTVYDQASIHNHLRPSPDQYNFTTAYGTPYTIQYDPPTNNTTKQTSETEVVDDELERAAPIFNIFFNNKHRWNVALKLPSHLVWFYQPPDFLSCSECGPREGFGRMIPSFLNIPTDTVVFCIIRIPLLIYIQHDRYLITYKNTVLASI